MESLSELARPETLGFDPKRLERVRVRISRDIDLGRYDGASLIVTRHGKTALVVREGYADREKQTSLKTDSTFMLFSMSKQLTATVALALIEDGAFRLTTPISEVIPEFGQGGKEKVNIFHLLTHTSGLPEEGPEITPEIKTNLEACAGWCFDKPLVAEPGTRVAYSRALAHTVLALFMQRVTGRPFLQLIQTMLFDPLGMKDSSMGPRGDLMERLCPPRSAQDLRHSEDPIRRGHQDIVDYVASGFLIPGSVGPGGAIITTAGDAQRFAEMLRGRGALGDVRILSPAMIDFVSHNYTGDSPNDMMLLPHFKSYNWVQLPGNIGCGFFIRGGGPTHGPFGTLNSPRTMGGLGMGSTFFWVDHARELSLIFLSTGLMDEGDNLSRDVTISDLVLSSIVDI